MTFHLRHLGMTLVDQPKGEELSSAAVKRIVATVRKAIFCFLVTGNFVIGFSLSEKTDNDSYRYCKIILISG